MGIVEKTLKLRIKRLQRELGEAEKEFHQLQRLKKAVDKVAERVEKEG